MQMHEKQIMQATSGKMLLLQKFAMHVSRLNYIMMIEVLIVYFFIILAEFNP